MLSACSYHWSETAPDGTPLAAAEPECRMQAQEAVRQQRPFYYEHRDGPAGFPPDSPADLEYRETERCLSAKGFRKIRD